MKAPARILVRSPNWIGDHVMALPFYRALKRLYPGSSLTLLQPPQVSGLVVGEFDAHWDLPANWRRPRELRNLSRRIRAEGFDLCFVLPASWSATLLAWLTGIPERVGFDLEGSGILLTHALRWKGARGLTHKSEQYLDLLRAVHPEVVAEPVTAPPAGTREKRIVVAPGAALGLREWPYFAELIEALSERYSDHEIELVGGEGERKWESRLSRAKAPRLCSQIGRTDLAGLRARCQSARLVIANDSGAAHVAATLAGTPTLVLFGPGNPEYIRPLGGTAVELFAAKVPCRPCDSNRCGAPFGYQSCLRDLSVGNVMEAAEAALSRK